MRVLAGLLAAVVTGGLGVTAADAFTDTFTPVQFTITVAQTARKDVALPITVGITAAPDAIAGSSAMWLQVKLASECGGSYATTPGTVLLDRRLSPQPAAGAAYTGRLSGSGRPTAYGVQTVCVFLDEMSDHRQFATNEEFTVNVSQPCTTSATAYDRAVRALKAAQRHRHGVRPARARAARARRTALHACGAGVAL